MYKKTGLKVKKPDFLAFQEQGRRLQGQPAKKETKR
jgi:hypothetical protein